MQAFVSCRAAGQRVLVLRFLAGSGLLGSAALGTVAMSVSAAPVAAQNAVSQQIDELRNAFGVGRTRDPIDFTERPPLVVPPTNALPPPGTGDPALGVNDPDVVARRRALSDPRRPVPPSDPGAGAKGYDARTYLVDPPSGMRDPNAAAGTMDTAKPEKATTHRHHARRKAAAAPAAQ